MNGAQDDTQSASDAGNEQEEDVCGQGSTPRRSGRSTGTSRDAGHSQGSYASSIPSSQLQSQTPGDAQEDQELANGAADLALSEGPITAQRLATFRAALGQLLSTDLFEDDSAQINSVLRAVNDKVGSRSRYGRNEATKALKKLEEANEIM